MALFIRPLFTPQSTICRRFGMATALAGRKKNEKLELPKDKTGIIIGKRKQAVYYPKVFLFSEERYCIRFFRKEFPTKPTQSMLNGIGQ